MMLCVHVPYLWIVLPALPHEVSKGRWTAARESGTLYGNKYTVTKVINRGENTTNVDMYSNNNNSGIFLIGHPKIRTPPLIRTA